MHARALAIVALLLASAAPVLAMDELSTARELYDRGVRMYNLQQFEGALDAFEGAYSAKQEPRLLFNIAQSQRQLGRYEAAARSYRAFLASGADPVDSAVAERLAREMDALAAAEKAPPPRTEPPTVAGAPAITAALPPPPRDRQRPLRLAGIATAGAGAGLIAAGAVLAGLSAREGEFALHGEAYDYDADQRFKALRAGAIATFALGGAAAAAGVTLWILGRRR